MSTQIIGYKVVGERQDGSWIEGETFDKEVSAVNEIYNLRMEFPDNEYWIESVWGEYGE